MLDAQDEARQILALLAVQAGGGLVEQQHAPARAPAPGRSRRASACRTAGSPPARGGSARARRTRGSPRRPRDARPPAGARRAGTASRQAGWCAMRAWRPVSRLSSTLICGNSSPCWKVRAMPSRAIACGGRPAMSRPRKRIAPCAAIDAADAVEHAGLAGAVRADQRQQLAALDRERNAVEHDEAAEAQRQIARSRAQPYHLRLRRYCLTSR